MKSIINTVKQERNYPAQAVKALQAMYNDKGFNGEPSS